jgi:hypothetical protein
LKQVVRTPTGTLYMVFHTVVQFGPGSAEAVSVATTGVVMSAAPIAAAAITFFIVRGSFFIVRRSFSVALFAKRPVRPENASLDVVDRRGGGETSCLVICTSITPR